jgi:hypothetical protein
MEPEEDEAGVRAADRTLSASEAEADPFSDADGGGEEESGEDLHDEGQAVPMGCVACAPPLAPPAPRAALITRSRAHLARTQ